MKTLWEFMQQVIHICNCKDILSMTASINVDYSTVKRPKRREGVKGALSIVVWD